jgi:hypothetical protein
MTGEGREKRASFIKEEELPVLAEWGYVCGIIFCHHFLAQNQISYLLRIMLALRTLDLLFQSTYMSRIMLGLISSFPDYFA